MAERDLVFPDGEWFSYSYRVTRSLFSLAVGIVIPGAHGELAGRHNNHFWTENELYDVDFEDYH